jgi:hypothetical protein
MSDALLWVTACVVGACLGAIVGLLWAILQELRRRNE